jgi:hypothetical protein
MKTKSIFNFLFLLFALSAILMTACVKEGPRGPAGQNGIDGNANVIASAWITPPAWSGDTADWYFDIISTAITQDIIDYGAVLAYMKIPGDLYTNDVRSMPAYVNGSNWDFLIVPATPNQIEFTSDKFTVPGTTGYSFRFVLIPSNSTLTLKSGSINGYKKSELQNMPYKDVCRILGIKE